MLPSMLIVILVFSVNKMSRGNTFHSYFKIHYSVPRRVKELTMITDDLLTTVGCTFKDVFASLISFIKSELSLGIGQPVIISHSGFLFNFPILISNCVKHGIKDFDILQHCLFTVSLQVFRDEGYQRAGFNSICQECCIKRATHSAFKDVELLRMVYKDQIISKTYTFKGVMTVFMNNKLPVPITQIYKLARECH